jgi:hypothetical protein
MLDKTLQKKRGCNKEKKRPTHHKQQKVPFQTPNRKRTKRVRIVSRRTSSCRAYSNTHNNGRRRAHREGESTLTLRHHFHRPRIPFRHVLIERPCFIKHCKKREGGNKEKKNQPTTQNYNKKLRFQNNKK